MKEPEISCHDLAFVLVLQLNFVRFYLPLLDISHSRVIYLDDDVIVQGRYQLGGGGS